MLYRMGTKTSIYLTDQLAAAVNNDRRSIPDLIRHGLAVRPTLVEDGAGGFTTHWYCAVPGKDVKFRVLRDHWRQLDGPPIREIYEIEITRGPEGDRS